MNQQVVAALADKVNIPEGDLTKVLKYHLSHVPHEEREDVAQDLVTELLAKHPETPGLAFILCKHKIHDWWHSYKGFRLFNAQYGSEPAFDSDDGTEVDLIDTIPDTVEFERVIDDKLDSEQLFGKLPKRIQGIVNKKLIGIRLTRADSVALHKFIKKHGDELLKSVA